MRSIEAKFLKAVKRECKQIEKLSFVSLSKMRVVILHDPDESLSKLWEKLEKAKRSWGLRKFKLPCIWHVSTADDLVGVNPLGTYYKTKAFKDVDLERLLRLRIQSRMGLDFPVEGFKEIE